MISTEQLQKKLAEVLDPDELLPSDNRLPTRLTAMPARTEQICELVKLAGRERITLLPIGGATRLYPTRETIDLSLSLAGLEPRIEHTPDDLTATVGAGMTFSSIQEQLSAHNQTIPLNPQASKNSTVGGVVSANAFGSRHHRYGSARDWVIGTTLVNGEGTVVTAGGKVVKNVSGYDLNKLYIGARGTLGIILEISFKLYPLPEKRSTILFRLPDVEKALAMANQIRKMPLQAETVTISNGEWNNDETTAWTLALEMAGSHKILHRQAETVFSTFSESDTKPRSLTEDESIDLWDRVNRGIGSEGEYHYFQARISLAKKDLRSFLAEGKTTTEENVSVKIFPGTGICHVKVPLAYGKSEGLMEMMIVQVQSLGGTVEFEMLPPGSKFHRWPILPSSFPWMKRLKQALDPAGIFSPGTYVGNI